MKTNSNLLKSINNRFNHVASSFIKVTGIVALTFSSLMATANTGTETSSPEKTIENHIRFPKLIAPMHKNEKVEVVFTTDANGKVNTVLAKTANTELKKEIEKQFSALTVPNTKSNIAYTIVLNFKTL